MTKRYSPNTNQLTSQSKINDYLSESFSGLPQNRIPTGVFIQSLKFNSSSEVNLTGYVWQIYDQSLYKDTSDDKIPVGFILPETVESGSNIEPKLTYRKNIGDDQEVVGWYFESTLKQKFNYTKYPFDHKTVWIRFWSTSFDRENILVPVLDSYQSTRIDDAFGYDEDIALGPWDIEETFFDFKKHNYNSNFGLYSIGEADPQPLPELYFNVVVRRRFLNSFIVYILPLILIACLIFSTLLMITKNKDQASMFGVNTSSVIGVCSGLFFVVLLSQVQIREQFAGSNIVYVEYFYPLMYTALLGISVNSYLFFGANLENNLILKWIDYEDNIVPKLIYWPVLLGSATIITAAVLLPPEKDPSSDISKLSPNQTQVQAFFPDKQLADESDFHKS